MKNILENIDKRKIFATILIILLIVSVLPMKGTEVQHNIITLKPQTKLFKIPENCEIKSIEITNHKHTFIPKEKPKMEFTTTSEENPDCPCKKIYTEPFTYDILLKGIDKYARINVPKIYYKNNNQYKTESISLKLNYNKKEQPKILKTSSYQTQEDVPTGQADMLIISNQTFLDIFSDNYRDWKINNDSKITTIQMFNISYIENFSYVWVNGSNGDASNISTGNPFMPEGKEIHSNYELFNDTQAQIRNFIRYSYDELNTRYVLLVGNKDVVPVRMVCSYAVSDCGGCTGWENDTSHASDMYYECLHYCMNNNTNDRWMENKVCGSPWDEIDWGYDVYVGRVLIDTAKEAFNWINKTKAYVSGRNQGNYLKNFIVAAKNNGGAITNQSWVNLGGEFSASLNDEFPSNITFLNNQNITQAQWSNLDDYVNGEISGWDGFHIILHQGHGGTLANPYQPPNNENEFTPNFLYTEGCTSGDFGTDTASRMEKWMKENDSCFALIANSASGWFGAGTYYVEEMMRQMFNDTTGNHTMQFSKAHQDAKEIYGHDPDCVWGMIVKETNFGGDPALNYTWYVEPYSHSYEIPQFISIENKGNGTNITTSTPTFNWSITGSTSQYNLQISKFSDFSVLIVNITDINEYTYPAECSINSTRVSFTLPVTHSLSDFGFYYSRVKSYQLTGGPIR